jgi:hypothetical protein
MALERVFSVRLKLSGGNVSITAYDPNLPRGPHGHYTLRCALAFRGKCVFGEPYMTIGVPSHEAIDSDAAKESAVALFCLKPGDTDEGFFRDYSPEQLAWVTQYGEELDLVKYLRFGSES